MPLHHRTKRRAVLAAVVPVAALAAACLPSAAQAGTVQSTPDGTLTYTDATGAEKNTVTIRAVNGRVRISDTSATMRTGTTQCAVLNGELDCATPVRFAVNLLGGEDRMEYRIPQAAAIRMGAGVDTVIGGRRQSPNGAFQPVTYAGEGDFDYVNYEQAPSGVTVGADDTVADGVPGEQAVVNGFEGYLGSPFADTLFGSASPDVITAGAGDDTIAGGFGDDVFVSSSRDGADSYHGGPQRDTIMYSGRAAGVSVSLDNAGNDGEGAESDNVQSNVENIIGGNGGDILDSRGAFSTLTGGAGDDTLLGGAGPDTLIGGSGVDTMNAGSENDVVDSRDAGERDNIDCFTGIDTLNRDTVERQIVGCETIQVGVLRLASKTITAKADAPARLDLTWRHPQGWRKLRSVTLRLTDAGMPVGSVTITPRDGRIKAGGVVRVARRATALERRGKAVAARLALRVDPSVAGRRLRLDVEATDTQGRRQLERDAGTLRVAK
jgi:hypothetical protein